MAMSVLSPRGQVAAAPASVAAPLVAARVPVRLALVSNGKPNAAELLDAIAVELARQWPALEVRRWRKPSVSVAPTAEQLAEIAEWAHATLNAVGD